ncbi:unnamed protein product [Rotaria magnacalcarata]|uniref:Lysosome membrane protein 2 n=1 Tax=Rotaria magnacalcarata TaxID=392030 RepID=A0A819B028_9BILA|nr:unnamed protein product [Rotaria magnacalcarata]CAF1645330.1 unnamed protein product [Rotaria magnacalcarata]CAF2090424.1 unnamed protein product [Rotaria magnacalcarata]CAF2091380.1 unnamed protein product [Rotaria magnacalcarata]CAF2115018.1 unnamed protein product [Rotaria magnacalcarata]
MIDRIRCASITLTIISIGFVVGGCLLIAFGDSLIKKIVKNECQLKPGTILYNNWRDSPVPYYISIYVFDLQNTEFLNGTSKPSLKQRGPFVYKEVREKINLEAYENETISYQEPRSYTFDASRSPESDTINVTTINLVYMILVNYLQMEHVPSIFRRIVGELLSVQEKPIMQHTVQELLWGYTDPLLRILKTEFPDIISDDRVSIFDASVSGAGSNIYLVNNGVGRDENFNDRINEVGLVERFNFESKLSYWSNEYANMINGTDSTLWHPSTRKNERIYSFISDICRSVYLDYNETLTNNFNIETYHYTLPNSVFSNSTENEGFCLNSTIANKTNELECLPSGLFSLKTCIRFPESMIAIPLPIIGSSPHFLAADPAVQNAVYGLEPDDIAHRSFVDIEPLTGIVMNGSRRLQVNLNVINDSAISAISRIRPVVYPMIWIDEHAEIDKPNADKFRKKVTVPITALHVMKYLILSIGIALFVIVLGLIAFSRYRTNTSGPAFPKAAADETSSLLF